ncbi:(Fe-S)-binding protein [Methylomonas sp. EFPC1]|uniref:(Fe-S)-binding protein n=1 Tax=Methylomonas sp. EFPC1 TaxID=2812647 RepID=UPI001967FEF4|nr:(Fe-S)-binding protein [Methylomonas sp. EFPC1]QSB02207.1 (Fe-S)-binding protein [Methylomonas sp. EFPC1]
MFDMMDFGMGEFTGDNGSQSPAPNGPYIPEASECMRCGMCVSSCPTFRLFEIDAETPRQRIRTISKILVEDVPISAEERAHLDSCLQCRACETACPSRMRYGALFDQARAKLQKAAVRPWLAKLAMYFIEHKRRRRMLLPMLSLYLRSGLRKPLRASGLLRKLKLDTAESLLNEPALGSLAGIYPVGRRQRQRGRVALFTGCLAEHFDRATQRAAIKLLNTIGYEVVVPEGQGCCGAIHQHNGCSAQALKEKNIEAFYQLEVDAVIYVASGCGAMLSEYEGDNSETAGWFAKRLQDINEFLLEHWPKNLEPAASNMNVAVHEPCSQRNVLKNGRAVHDLLRKIPGLNIEALPDNQLCCGAGGSYMLSHPDNAQQLRNAKRQAIEGSGADVVVSSNFSCAFYLNADRAETARKLVHPIRLLADRV